MKTPEIPPLEPSLYGDAQTFMEEIVIRINAMIVLVNRLVAIEDEKHTRHIIVPDLSGNTH